MANLPFGPHRVIDRMSALSDLLETGALEDVYVPLFRETVHCDWCGTILPGMNGDPATGTLAVCQPCFERDFEAGFEMAKGEV